MTEFTNGGNGTAKKTLGEGSRSGADTQGLCDLGDPGGSDVAREEQRIQLKTRVRN